MQPSPAPLILLLLQALLSTAAVLRPNVNNKPTENQEGIVGYNILDCGDKDAKLIEIVDLARKSVLPAIEDLSHPNVDSHTFEALIGPKPRLAKAILPLLVAVRDFLGVGGREPAWYKDDPPIFMCVQENTQQLHPELENIVDPHKYCQDRTDAWAFSDTRFRYIFLCDRFWDPEHKPEPETPRAEREACPRFEANMFMDEDGERLASFQKYLIVHELLHMYMLDGGLRDDSDPKEVYSLNDCMRMNYETNRIRNPNNVVYYVAMREQGCYDAPNPNVSPWSRGQYGDANLMTIDDSDIDLYIPGLNPRPIVKPGTTDMFSGSMWGPNERNVTLDATNLLKPLAFAAG